MPDTPPPSNALAAPRAPRPRLWPMGVVLVLLIVLLGVTIAPQLSNYVRFLTMMAGPIVCGALALAWLLLLSRLRWFERIAVAFGSAVLVMAAVYFVHASVRPLLFIYGVPMAVLMIGVGVTLGRSARPVSRIGVVLACVAAGMVTFAFVRLDGFDGAYLPELSWRWTPTPEERLLALDAAAPVGSTDVRARAIELGPLDWPGFRGAHRNGRVDGVRVLADWENSPPRERWRIAVGPGISSFAHVDGRLFTQEQRGEDEAIVCYDADTGAEIWRHTDETRFDEVVSGAGPRATPTFHDGRLYAMGAKAALTCLDAATGALLWQRDLVAEIDATQPIWGFTSSPLVTHDVAIVYADGRDDHGLVAYDARTGEPAWQVAARGMNYASAQLATIAGVELVLFVSERGLLAIDPATGEIAWRFTPSDWRMAPIIQPHVIGDRTVIVPLGDGVGLARVDVERNGDAWRFTERWSSPRLKPSFNDFVHHGGHLYGFDQAVFTCIDAETGAKSWRGGRYGFGQVLLLAESSSLIVTSETGEVVLVAADPSGHRELGRLEAMDAKTWNHPIVVGNRLFVRNGEEAICYELPVADGIGK